MTYTPRQPDLVGDDLRCARCGESKSLDAFRRLRSGAFASYCTPCQLAQTQEWRARHRDEINAKRRAEHVSRPYRPRPPRPRAPYRPCDWCGTSFSPAIDRPNVRWCSTRCRQRNADRRRVLSGEKLVRHCRWVAAWVERERARRDRLASRVPTFRVCRLVACGATFEATWHSQIFCSVPCQRRSTAEARANAARANAARADAARGERVCPGCGTSYHVRRNDQVCCTLRCAKLMRRYRVAYGPLNEMSPAWLETITLLRQANVEVQRQWQRSISPISARSSAPPSAS